MCLVNKGWKIHLFLFLCVPEKGDFLALDLGGSKFRVLKVKVSEDGKQHVQMESQFYPTPKEIIHGNGTDVRNPSSSGFRCLWLNVF